MVTCFFTCLPVSLNKETEKMVLPVFMSLDLGGVSGITLVNLS